MANEDLFRILVATDVHMGYMEKDDIRGMDSFNSFEEVLKVAKEKKVDFILLAGDLFHENRPSPQCLFRCTEALRMYCLGDEEVKFQLVSDQKENFNHTRNFPFVNFEDANLNVCLPVFSIHGNHDDPTGKNPSCFLENFSAAGLINYFGKYTNMDNIEVKPLLLQKGLTKIALYGLGSLPEERLHRFFMQQKIKFLRPEEDTEQWFNIFIVHQNRVPHGTKFLPEKFLSNLPHLVIWGHEHESKPDLDYNQDMGFHVLQPGSTVATSLCPGEAVEKNMFVLDIVYDSREGSNRFKVTPVPLKTVRPFLFDTMDLDEELSNRSKDFDRDTVMKICTEKVEQMIDQANIDHSGNDDQPKLPLIRLKVEASRGMPFSTYQLGLQFKGRVANPSDLILYKVKRLKNGTAKSVDDKLLSSVAGNSEGSSVTNIEDIVTEYFSQAEEKDQLKLLSEKALTMTVKDMVEKETDSIESVLDKMLEKTRQHLMNQSSLTGHSKEEILGEIKALRKASRAKEMEDMKKLMKEIHASSSTNETRGSEKMAIDDDVDEIEISSDEETARQVRTSAASSSRGRGRGRSRGRATTVRGRKGVFVYDDKMDE